MTDPNKSVKNLKNVASSVASALSGVLTFQKTLSDLVKGIRNSSNSNEATFISQCIQEIKEELKSEDIKTRMVAVQKLTYVRTS